MQYIYGTTNILQSRESVVVLGNFDGVHVGHQKLFKLARKKADELNLQVVALSFYPHPTWKLGHHPKPLIMSREDKQEKIQQMGVDVFIEYPFTLSFANIAPDIFFKEILLEQIKTRVIVVGYNYYFGKDKQGDIAYMQKLGALYNVTICAVDTVKIEGEVVSSTHVRELISAGKIQELSHFLGRPYSVRGKVIHGKKLGRMLGFPTINMLADTKQIYPPNGVYATTVKVYNQLFMGITNIGYNPTVNGDQKMIETNIFGFNQSIYDQEVEISFYYFIRSEKKFTSLDELKAQITQDKEKVEILLKDITNSLQG